MASSGHLSCTSRGQLKRATPHASSTLTDSEARMRFQHLTPHATANIRLSLGTEDQLQLGVKDEPHTHTQDHKRVQSNTQWTDSRSPDSCPRFSMTSLSKDPALMFLLLQKHKKHKQQDLGRLTRHANCECKRFIDTVARRSDDNPVFRPDEDLRLSSAYL